MLFAAASFLSAATGEAQTVNPRTVVFTASPDHNTLDASGQPVVTGYELDFYPAGGTQAVQVLNLGKPAPAADGTITVDFSSMLSSAVLPGQQLDATVAAVGPSGRGESAPSNTFIFDCSATVSPTTISATSAGGNSSVGITIYSGCTWQATSGASWITITSAASGLGSGTVTLTTAANTTSATRTGTLTVAGQIINVTQAAGTGTNAPPTVSVTSPANGAKYTAPASIPVSATASDSDGTVTNVSVYNGSTLLGSAATSLYTGTWNVTTAGTYTITATATDNSGATTTSAGVTVTVAAADTTAPSVAFTTPTSAATYSTSTTPLAIGGTASDNVGVTQVTWANSLGGSGTASGTANWSASVALVSGSNVITVTAKDAAGNTKTATLTVTYTPADTTAPSVAFTTPTSAATYSASTTPLAIGGTASDNVGVTQVTWANSLGGSGTASGTANWSASVALQSGSNVITVTAKDAAGNTKTATLTVTYTPPDTTAPTVAIITPTTAASFSASSTPLAIGGTASDDVGVTQVTWANGLGGSGIASGTANWSASVALQSGSNVITVTAKDAAGNAKAATLTVTYTPPDTTAPSVAFTTPTSAATYSTSSTPLAIGGTASDDVGVTQVTWANSLGGSGVASGTTAWSASVALQPGSNLITVTARDAAGNTKTATLTVAYTPPDTIAPTVTINAPLAATSTTATPLSLTGTASDNVGVAQVMWANSLGGSGVASGTTNWSTSVPLQVGTNVITVTARDAAGNTGSATLSVSYAPPTNTGPSVQITNPVNGATLTGPTTLTATASDSNGIYRVDFYVNGTLIASDLTAPYSVRWNTSSSGTFTITAVATDTLGLATTSAPVTVTFAKKNGKR